MKRICKRCNKMFPSFGDIICTSCRTYENYVASHPKIVKTIEILPELHFDFTPKGLARAFDNRGGKVLGSCQVDQINQIAHVRIDLYRFKDLTPAELISELVRVIIHEYNHWAIFDIYKEEQAMSKYDNLDYYELERWLKN